MENREKKPRYQGYDLVGTEKVLKAKGWFWKVFGVSLLASFILVALFIGLFFRRTQKITKFVDDVNKKNTMASLLKDHDNVRITQTYAHLEDRDDYKTTRQVELDQDDTYYSYYKEEGTIDDYKEVIKNQRLYRSDDKHSTFYGLTQTDYEEYLVPDIEDDVFQINSAAEVKDQRESGDIVKLDLAYTVQANDAYNIKYGFEPGIEITITVTLDKQTSIIMSETETVNDEEFYSYTLAFDVTRKVPNFYKELRQIEDSRNVTVYYDYNGANAKTYLYKVPVDVYFRMYDRDGYKTYLDPAATKAFTDYQAQIQNTLSDMILYVIKESD